MYVSNCPAANIAWYSRSACATEFCLGYIVYDHVLYMCYTVKNIRLQFVLHEKHPSGAQYFYN